MYVWLLSLSSFQVDAAGVRNQGDEENFIIQCNFLFLLYVKFFKMFQEVKKKTTYRFTQKASVSLKKGKSWVPAACLLCEGVLRSEEKDIWPRRPDESQLNQPALFLSPSVSPSEDLRTKPALTRLLHFHLSVCLIFRDCSRNLLLFSTRFLSNTLTHGSSKKRSITRQWNGKCHLPSPTYLSSQEATIG